MEVLLSKNSIGFFSNINKQNFTDRLLSLLETYAQNVMFDGLEKNFNEHNLAVSIVNSPNNRSEPIIGFTFGMYNPYL